MFLVACVVKEEQEGGDRFVGAASKCDAFDGIEVVPKCKNGVRVPLHGLSNDLKTPIVSKVQKGVSFQFKKRGKSCEPLGRTSRPFFQKG